MKTKKKEEQEAKLDSIRILLNSNFKAIEVERYPNATLGFMINEYLDKYHGDRQKRISLNTQKKVHKAVYERLRKMYGPWVTVRIKNAKKWVWDTNLGQVYKTENGRIYGTSIYDDLFITSHALERWEERVDIKLWAHFDREHLRRFNIKPSALDRVMFLFETAIQIGIYNEDPHTRYLNVNGGIFVIQILKGIMIVKTFLKYDMFMPPLIWYGIESGTWLTDISSIIDPDSEFEEDILKTEEEIPPDFCCWFFR